MYTYNHRQPAILGTNIWEEDDASINEPAKVEEDRAKEDHVAQQPAATAANFYITFLPVPVPKLKAAAGTTEDDNDDHSKGAEDNQPGFHVLVAYVQKSDHKAQETKKQCQKHVFAGRVPMETFIPAAENGDLHQNMLKVVLGR